MNYFLQMTFVGKRRRSEVFVGIGGFGVCVWRDWSVLAKRLCANLEGEETLFLSPSPFAVDIYYHSGIGRSTWVSHSLIPNAD